MTCRVTHRKKYGLILCQSLFEGIFSPRVPVNLQYSTAEVGSGMQFVKSIMRLTTALKHLRNRAAYRVVLMLQQVWGLFRR